MKQLDIQVPSGRGEVVLRLAREHGAASPYHHRIQVDGDADWTRISLTLANQRVGSLIAAVEEQVPEAQLALPTSEILSLRSPISDLRDRVADVSRKSTLELVLGVHQSIGSWTGLLAYALISGLVAAYGIIFGISFLLTAAMLIAPVGAPAMVCVVGVILGDTWMLRRGATRFFAALLVLAGAAALLGLGVGLSRSTAMMELLASLSWWTALLGVAGGAAGAQALVQAERDSLVTATATGFLVAVSLSPPAAVLGLSLVIGRWDYAGLMIFLILLTLAGILVGGWLALRARGVGPDQFTAGRGGTRSRRLAFVAVAVALLALLGWQVSGGPDYRKSDLTREAAAIAAEAVREGSSYQLLMADATFARGNAGSEAEEALIVRLLVTPPESGSAARASEDSLRARVARRIVDRMPDVVPFVDVTALPRSVQPRPAHSP